MQCEQFLLTIGSDHPARLRSFYRDVVGLIPMDVFAPGAFAVGPAASPAFIVESHDAVVGASKEPERLLLNFVVKDALAEQDRLESLDVSFLRPLYEEPGIGLFATFLDPDGNYCQLVQLFP